MKGKIIIAGGTGYIGSHTAVELINQGYEVILVDNLSNSEAFIIDRIAEITGTRPEFELLDLRDEDKTNQFFEKHKDADGVIDFAALKAVGESIEKPLLYYKNNLDSLMNILEAMLQNGVPNLIFSSSATVYGQPDELPVREDAETKRPISPYGNTKKMSEEIIEDVVQAHSNLNAISLRYFNPIGAHDSGLIGEMPTGTPNNLMPYITQTAAGLREQLYVFGNDYNSPDGTAVRDYIHVVDLAKAHVIAMDRLIEQKTKANYEVFNIGTGQANTVLEVIQSFEKASGQPLNYVIVGRREGDVESLYADPTKANEDLGWKSTLSLDDMTKSSWNWEKNLRKGQKEAK